MELRPAEAHELPSILSSLMRIIDEIPIYNQRAKDYERKLYTPDYLLDLLASDKQNIFGAFNDQSIAGFLICRDDNGPLWLSWFGVSALYRGQAVGKQLISTMLDTLASRGIHKIWCDTRTNNYLSMPILQSLGFIKLCHLENHWCNQDYYLWERRTPVTFDASHQRDS